MPLIMESPFDIHVKDLISEIDCMRTYHPLYEFFEKIRKPNTFLNVLYINNTYCITLLKITEMYHIFRLDLLNSYPFYIKISLNFHLPFVCEIIYDINSEIPVKSTRYKAITPKQFYSELDELW